jgi:hypothetical protein
VNHFRRYSKGYTGQKKVAYRDYTFSEEDFNLIRNLIIEIKNKHFAEMDALQVTQVIRGRIFTMLEVFMTYSHKEPSKVIPSLVETLYDFLDLAVKYLEFFKENFKYADYLDKFPDLYLIDEKCAVISCYFEIMLTLRRIFGRDERVNNFYKVNFI